MRTAVRQVRDLRDRGYRFVVDADIDEFFASIPHERLLTRLEALELHPFERSKQESPPPRLPPPLDLLTYLELKHPGG